MSSIEAACLESWRKFCPDFQLNLWDESNFPIDFCEFTAEAYRLGKYAFVSDVARVFAVEKCGGIYLDTDMLLLKPLDSLLANSFFIGEHLPGEIGVGVFGGVKQHPFLVEVLNVYQSLSFEPDRLVLVPDLFDKLIQDFDTDKLKIYPSDYFYPLPFSKKGLDYSSFITSSSFAVHLWNHSWKDEFAYLKEHRFWKAFSLFVHHIVLYPNTYLSKSFLFRFATESKAMLKQYLYFKLKGNRD